MGKEWEIGWRGHEGPRAMGGRHFRKTIQTGLAGCNVSDLDRALSQNSLLSGDPLGPGATSLANNGK